MAGMSAEVDIKARLGDADSWARRTRNASALAAGWLHWLIRWPHCWPVGGSSPR